jgi:hypothetical protein
MTNKEIPSRPILTLGGASKTESDTLENRPTLSDKEIEKGSEIFMDTSDKVSQVLKTKASADPEIKPKASPKAEYDFNAIYDELHTKFPNIINMDKPVLLAIAVRGEMLKKVSVPNAVLYKWIAWYFRKSNYYALHEVGAMRYNLNGSEALAVTEKDQAKRNKQMGKTKERQSQQKDKDNKETSSKKQDKNPAKNKSENLATAADVHSAK